MTRPDRLARWSPWLAGSLFAAALGCAQAPGELAPAAAVPAPAPAPLAEGRFPGSQLRLQITGVARPGRDVLEISFALVNPGTAPAASPTIEGGPGLAWLAAVYLEDEGGRKRYYAVRDAEGRVTGTPAAVETAAGGRQAVSARFPAPGPGGGRLTVVVPGLPPFRGIPFPPGTDAGGPSY